MRTEPQGTDVLFEVYSAIVALMASQKRTVTILDSLWNEAKATGNASEVITRALRKYITEAKFSNERVRLESHPEAYNDWKARTEKRIDDAEKRRLERAQILGEAQVRY